MFAELFLTNEPLGGDFFVLLVATLKSAKNAP